MGVETVRKRVKIVILILILFMLTPIGYVQLNKLTYANKVQNYLIDVENYSKEEIKYVKGVWGKKLPSFYAVVVFHDEPNVEYIYFAHSEVLQFSYRMINENNNRTHSEADLKHYIPIK